MKLNSLRARLILIILTPLLVIALVAAAWQFRNTTQRAANIFDRGLLSAALAISRDVAVSDGDGKMPGLHSCLASGRRDTAPTSTPAALRSPRRRSQQ